MTKNEAADYLAMTVAEYILNDFPLSHLTGDCHNRPDPVHAEKLREALCEFGKGTGRHIWTCAANKVERDSQA